MTGPGARQCTAGPRRVALVCDWCLPRFGGLELQLIDLARALRTAGHHPEIITSTPGERSIDGIPIRRLEGWRAPIFGFACSPRQFHELGAILGSGAFDTVHVHSGVIAPVAYGSVAIATRLGIATALTFHSVYDYLEPALHALAFLSGAREFPVAWSAVSQRVAREASRALDGISVDILPNGIDAAPWRAVAGSWCARPGNLRLITVMRLQVRKRPGALFDILDQAQRAAGSTVRITLDIVGDGPERRAVERRARQAGIGRVRLFGRLPREEIPRLFSDADAFVLPTRIESFGIAALEAMCAGLPVLARRGTGVEDFVQHGRNGLLGQSDRELGDAVVALARNDELRAGIAHINRESVPPYSWGEVVTRTLALYDRAEALREAWGGV